VVRFWNLFTASLIQFGSTFSDREFWKQGSVLADFSMTAMNLIGVGFLVEKMNGMATQKAVATARQEILADNLASKVGFIFAFVHEMS